MINGEAIGITKMTEDEVTKGWSHYADEGKEWERKERKWKERKEKEWEGKERKWKERNGKERNGKGRRRTHKDGWAKHSINFVFVSQSVSNLSQSFQIHERQIGLGAF